MKTKFYNVVSWAQSQFLSDNLNYKKIPFELYVISWTRCCIEIPAEYLHDARSICDGWEEV
jgi:hypothetical protein